MPATATLSKARVSHALTYALKFFFYVCTSYEYLNDFMDSMEVKQVINQINYECLHRG